MYRYMLQAKRFTHITATLASRSVLDSLARDTDFSSISSPTAFVQE